MHLRAITVALATTAVTLTGTTALADQVVNDVPDVVDGRVETMLLQYDRDGIAGPSGRTTLSIVVEGRTVADEHDGCNLEGRDSLSLQAAFDPAVVTLTYPNGATFGTCDDRVLVVVTPTGIGNTTVEFSELDKRGNAVKKDFKFGAARFRVEVEEAELGDGGGSGTVCDRNPAAPAWANAILRANDVKLRGDDRRDVIRSVAQRMEKAASFPDNDATTDVLVAKSAPEYPGTVYEYMKTSDSLETTGGGTRIHGVGPEGVDRPERVCTTVTAR